MKFEYKKKKIFKITFILQMKKLKWFKARQLVPSKTQTET